jgi:purine-binding chemotaxis protein CheW
VTAPAPSIRQVLLVRAGERACAIPLTSVAETMRPLSIEPMPGTPAFVRGVSMIRGVPTPVLDLNTLLNNGAVSPSYGRLVTLKVEERRIALGVDEVLGVKHLAATELGELPPLFRDSSAAGIDALSADDAELVVVLRAARLVPDSVWERLSKVETSR